MKARLFLTVALACVPAGSGCKTTPRHSQGVVIRDFAFPWADQPAPRTECRLDVRGGRLHFAFDVEDRDVIVEAGWRGESTADGYRIEGSVPLATLSKLVGQPVASGSELRVGLFRAEFYGRAARTRGEAPDNWLSWVRPDTKQPDFHVPSAFRLLRLP